VERPVVVGRRRFASLPENVPLPTLNLVKIEGQGEISLVKKEDRGTDKRVVLSPHWASDDLTNMASVLEFHKTCLSSLSSEFENVSQEKNVLEGEIRRTQIMMSDRAVLIALSKHQLQKLSLDETVLQRELSKNRLLEGDLHGRLFASLGDDQVLSKQAEVVGEYISSACSGMEGLQFKKSIEERTLSYHNGEAATCELELSKLQKKLLDCSNRHSTISARICNSDKMQAAYAEQLSYMRLGGGAATYPLPLSTNPSEPEQTTQLLNACPLYGLWYKCYNHLSFVCSHTYHPWCAVQQLKISLSCLVPFYDGIATAEWQAALEITQGGRRPREKQKNDFPPKAPNFPILQDTNQGEGQPGNTLCSILCSYLSLVNLYSPCRKRMACLLSFYSPQFSFVSEHSGLYYGT
jgi:hypothetical protein